MSASAIPQTGRTIRDGFGSRRVIAPPPVAPEPRMDWVDYAKGWCIILVVMMHSVGGLSEALGTSGFINEAVAFAKPFRMPDFFLIAGLFLARGIDLPWRRFLDRKLLHFVYLYAIWVTIQIGLKHAPLLLESPGEFLMFYLGAFINPLGTLWFIFILPAFFIVTKAAKEAGISGPALLIGAAVLEIGYQIACMAMGISNPALHIGPLELTGFIVIDEFSQRYVFFVAGYLLAPAIFKLAGQAAGNLRATLMLLAGWAVINALLVYTPASALGLTSLGHSLAALPVISLALGAAGAAAIICVSALLAEVKGLEWLRSIGSRSVIVYLAFFLPMAITRESIAYLAPWLGVTFGALIVTAIAVAAPLILYQLIKGTSLIYLFKRPAAVSLLDRPDHGRAQEA
jgi:uncharacterized membrane protein YcfT